MLTTEKSLATSGKLGQFDVGIPVVLHVFVKFWLISVILVDRLFCSDLSSPRVDEMFCKLL